MAAAFAASLLCVAQLRPAALASAVTPADELDAEQAELQAVRAAVVAGQWPRVQAWVERHGLDAPVTPMGQSALCLAAERGSVHVVRALLAAAADPEACDNQGLSTLLHGARQGHAPVVQELLRFRASPDKPTDIFGNAPLHGAVGFGHAIVAQCLLRARADPNQRTGDIRAPASYGAHTLHEAPLHLTCLAKPPHVEATLWFLLTRTAPELADFAAHGARNARGATAAEEAAGGPWAVSLALRLGPAVARLRQRLQLPPEGDGGGGAADEAAEEEAWAVYRARLDSGSSLLPFEEGGDGVRRRAG